MLPYSVFIEKRALGDVQEAFDYYNSQQFGLGDKFLSVIDKHFQSISQNPFYQIRYSNVRCLPVRKFPFMIHFVVDEKNKNAYVISILHTSQDPNNYPKSIR